MGYSFGLVVFGLVKQVGRIVKAQPHIHGKQFSKVLKLFPLPFPPNLTYCILILYIYQKHGIVRLKKRANVKYCLKQLNRVNISGGHVLVVGQSRVGNRSRARLP